MREIVCTSFISLVAKALLAVIVIVTTIYPQETGEIGINMLISLLQCAQHPSTQLTRRKYDCFMK